MGLMETQDARRRYDAGHRAGGQRPVGVGGIRYSRRSGGQRHHARTRPKKQVVQFLDDRGIPIIDPLMSLRQSLAQASPFPAGDGHFNSFGYEVIAKSIIEQTDEFRN